MEVHFHHLCSCHHLPFTCRWIGMKVDSRPFVSWKVLSTILHMHQTSLPVGCAAVMTGCQTRYAEQKPGEHSSTATYAASVRFMGSLTHTHTHTHRGGGGGWEMLQAAETSFCKTHRVKVLRSTKSPKHPV